MNQLLSTAPKQSLTESKPVHTFSLKPLSFLGSALMQFEADFSPCKSNESSPVSTLPSFNSDGKHFTPAFYVSSEMNQQEQWELSFLQNFQNKKNQCTSQNKHLLLARPESRYCQVCNQYFQDYLKHTKHTVHVKKLREGSMESEIHKLVQYFKNTEKSFKRNSSVFIEDRKSSGSLVECEEGLILRKKVKTQTRQGSQQNSETSTNIGSLKFLAIESKNSQLQQL